jgi:hypothetical protein
MGRVSTNRSSIAPAMRRDEAVEERASVTQAIAGIGVQSKSHAAAAVGRAVILYAIRRRGPAELERSEAMPSRTKGR